MIYALIRDGVIQDMIVADPNFIEGIHTQWDACVEVTNMDPMPGIGWSYDGSFHLPSSDE